MRSYRTLAALGILVVTVGATGCKSKVEEGPPVPASSDPEGKDLVPGAVVAAVEKTGGVRLYKIIDSVYFPPPMSDELVMIAYHEKGDDFRQAASLWSGGKLNVALSQVRVQRHLFRTRDYRILATVPVTDADRTAKAVDKPPVTP
jgi:hypothetical protein